MVAENERDITRREFISKGVKGAALVGMGSIMGLSARDLLASKDVANTISYDMEKLSAIDPALILYREVGKIASGAKSLNAVAIGPENRIYLAADKAICIFDRGLSLVSEIKLGSSPKCIAVAEDGSVYVGTQNGIEIYSTDGNRMAGWDGFGQNEVFTSIAVSENDIFVADAGNRVILRYDISGKFVRRIGERNKRRNIPGFVVPSPYFDVAISSDGLLRVANPGEHRVEAYTFDGDYEFSWGKPTMAIDGFCGCCNPVNIAILPDGKFVTCEKGLPRIKVYGADGKFESVIAGPAQFAKNAKLCATDGLSDCRKGGMDIAVDSTGQVAIMDPVARTIRIFAPTKEAKS